MGEEEAYLDKVMKLLNQKKEEYSKRLTEGKQKVIEIRKEMYEETPRGISSWDDVYELNSMDAQERKFVHEYGIDYENWKELLAELDSPYFGRVDFKEDGEDCEELIYIGTYAIKDTKSFRYYVYDWRSPIASLYYDYTLGKAQYEAPMGTFCGEISKKRQYRITNGTMRYWFDTDTNIEDELLARTLSENTDGKLKVIVSSIQKEQNQVIRMPSKEILYVFGPAGSGKTSVGLHRLAYLLYHNRDKLAAKNIVIVANNEIFSSYISNILPNLGEEEPVMGVFYNYIKKYIPDEYETNDLYDMLETIMGTSQSNDREESEIRRQGIQLKSSEYLLANMKQYLASYHLEPIRLYYYEDEIADAAAMEYYIRTDFAENNIKVTIDQVNEYMERAVRKYFDTHQARIQELYYERTGEYVMEDKLEVFCYKERVRTTEELKRLFLQTNHLDVMELYLSFLTFLVREQKLTEEIYAQTELSVKNKRLHYEDEIIILCLLESLGKIAPDLHILQVVIDEAQDYNIMQMYFLKNLYPKSHFTILADSNQAVEGGFSTRNMNSFDHVFHGNKVICRLTKSYRSTAQINCLANHLLQENEGMEYVERQGEKPQLICTNDYKKSIGEVIVKEQKENHSIGVLVYSSEQAARLYQELKDQFKIQLIADAQEELKEELVILPILYAKGLEFDCVIGAGDFTEDSIRWRNQNTLYLMCTRALHRLYLLSSVGVPKELQQFIDEIEIMEDVPLQLDI